MDSPGLRWTKNPYTADLSLISSGYSAIEDPRHTMAAGMSNKAPLATTPCPSSSMLEKAQLSLNIAGRPRPISFGGKQRVLTVTSYSRQQVMSLADYRVRVKA
jgi:hypothetical protein